MWNKWINENKSSNWNTAPMIIPVTSAWGRDETYPHLYSIWKAKIIMVSLSQLLNMINMIKKRPNEMLGGPSPNIEYWLQPSTSGGWLKPYVKLYETEIWSSRGKQKHAPYVVLLNLPENHRKKQNQEIVWGLPNLEAFPLNQVFEFGYAMVYLDPPCVPLRLCFTQSTLHVFTIFVGVLGRST